MVQVPVDITIYCSTVCREKSAPFLPIFVLNANSKTPTSFLRLALFPANFYAVWVIGMLLEQRRFQAGLLLSFKCEYIFHPIVIASLIALRYIQSTLLSLIELHALSRAAFISKFEIEGVHLGP